MCGIVGFVGASSREVLQELLAGIRHRGPDDSGMLVRGTVGLAHARLAVIDPSPTGHQPMELPDGSVAIVFNGEIYNFRELRERLSKRGVSFAGASDTEVLLWLYKFEGEDFLRTCDGMFALALYDFSRGRLLLARDRMGEKPLYWCKRRGVMYFASELGALLRAGVTSRRVDRRALARYLALDYVPTPGCIVKDVYKLEPATCLLHERDVITRRTFWQGPREISRREEGEVLSGLDSVLEHSVAKELVSDVPLGIFLSGGLDSSTIAYYARRAAPRGIDTFSIGFDEPSFDESKYAREVASHIGSRHHEHLFSVKDALSLLPEVPQVFSEPVADASVLPTMLLSRFARGSVTVALGGDGGDELFAGYPTFQAETLARIFSGAPRAARRVARFLAGMLPASRRNFAFSYNLKKLLSSDEVEPARRHGEWLGSFGLAERLALAGPVMREALESEDPLSTFEYCARETGSEDGNALLWTYARTYLMDEVLAKVDRASMHYALEVRAPYLDRALVEYAFSLPYELKYRRGSTKYLLKALMRRRLPPGIVDRKKKGFGMPLARWLTGPLAPLCDELLSERALAHGFFDVRAVERLKREHRTRRHDRRKELWNLMVFQLWYRKWID